MISIRKHKALIIPLTLLGFSSPGFGAELLLAAQPSVTVEPHYQSGEFDFNLLPLVVGLAMGEKVDVRFSPTLNYHVAATQTGIEQIGLDVLVPNQLFKVGKVTGIFIGPCLGYSRWMLSDTHSLTLCGEGGAIIRWPSDWELKAGLQFGSTYFSNPSPAIDKNWKSHLGVKISFGYWMTK